MEMCRRLVLAGSSETNESFTIFSGRMTVTEDGGQPLELASGDSAIFPKGWTGSGSFTKRS